MTKEEAETIEAAGAYVLSAGTLEQGSALGNGVIELVLEHTALVRFDLHGSDAGSTSVIDVPLDLLVPAPETW